MIVAPLLRATERLIGADSADAGKSGIRLELVIPADLHYLQGHFPGCPLLPGVVQLTWAIDFAKQYLPIVGSFRGVSNLKFMRVIQPDRPVSLTLDFEAAKNQLTFEYRNADGVCSSGGIAFA